MALSLVGCGSNSATETSAQTAETTAAGAASETEKTAPPSDTQGQKDIKLTVGWWGNQVRNDRTQEVLEMYSAANPGVTFDSQPAQFADYWTKLATAAAGNALPDVLQMNYSSYVEQYVDNNLLEDLGPYVEQGILDISSIDQSILDSGSVDGKL